MSEDNRTDKSADVCQAGAQRTGPSSLVLEASAQPTAACLDASEGVVQAVSHLPPKSRYTKAIKHGSVGSPATDRPVPSLLQPLGTDRLNSPFPDSASALQAPFLGATCETPAAEANFPYDPTGAPSGSCPTRTVKRTLDPIPTNQLPAVSLDSDLDSDLDKDEDGEGEDEDGEDKDDEDEDGEDEDGEDEDGEDEDDEDEDGEDEDDEDEDDEDEDEDDEDEDEEDEDEEDEDEDDDDDDKDEDENDEDEDDKDEDDADEDEIWRRWNKAVRLCVSKIQGRAEPRRPRIGPQYQAIVPPWPPEQ